MGLNTTLYTAFAGMFLHQWRVGDPARVVEILKGRGWNVGSDFTQSEYEHLSGQARSLSIIATGCPGGSGNCRIDAGGQSINGHFVSANFFQVLGARMALGRGFHRDEDLPHVTPVAVISERFWRRHLGADPAAVGASVRLDGMPFTVVGVVHDSFIGPALIRRDVWVPLGASSLLRPSEEPELSGLHLAGRLAPGATPAQAAAELDALFAALPAPPPQANRERTRIVLTPSTYFEDHHDRDEALVGFAILAAGVLLVLLLACANAGNLLLARTIGRRRELSVRCAIGADRSRLVRQLLTESLLLSTIAAAIGLLLAAWLPTLLLNAIYATTNVSGPIGFPMRPDGLVLAATAGLVVLTCVGFGLAPALYASRPDVATLLKGRVAGKARGCRCARFCSACRWRSASCCSRPRC
jgi:predicted permease